MNDTEIIEDNKDRAQYCCIPSLVNVFEGIGAMYVLISQWVKKRKARKQEKSKVEQEIATIEN